MTGVRYRVTHRTRYSYPGEVTDSIGVAHLVPRSTADQQVAHWRVGVDPEPTDDGEETDVFGNTTTYFQVRRPHRVLEVVGSGEVTVRETRLDDDAMAVAWERLRPLAEPGAPGAWAAAEMALASPAVPLHEVGVDLVAPGVLAAGRPVGEAVLDLVGRLHRGFEYDPTATTVTSPVADVVARRAGVCQDFAHLLLACLRRAGLAARYVSGYLATEPAPGQDRVVGADASHAWVAVWLGEDRWLAVDPTNDQVVGDRHVTVAWGRDYTDVPPVKGVIFTDAPGSELEVSVDVEAVGTGDAAPR